MPNQPFLKVNRHFTYSFRC